MRYELTDYEWTAIKPFLPNKPRGVPRVNDRRVLNGIFWVLRSGAPWRDLPETFGPYTTCYNRFVRWGRAGVWDQIMDALAAMHDAAVQMIDTSIVRVHQHGARSSASSGRRLHEAVPRPEHGPLRRQRFDRPLRHAHADGQLDRKRRCARYSRSDRDQFQQHLGHAHGTSDHAQPSALPISGNAPVHWPERRRHQQCRELFVRARGLLQVRRPALGRAIEHCRPGLVVYRSGRRLFVRHSSKSTSYPIY
jgi:transposase